MNERILSCDALDELLPDYLDGTLAAESRARAERHVGSCVRCTGLVRDLMAIRREAGSLPELEPSRELWAGIAERIEAPVIELAPAAVPRPRRWSAAWMAAAAAGLVLATALTTYSVTMRLRHDDARRVALVGVGGAPSAAASTDRSEPPALPAPSSRVRTSEEEEVERAEPATTAAVAGSRGAAVRPPSPVAASVTGASLVGRSDAELTYDREIEQLRTIVAVRRGLLDTATVAVLERNLAIIDSAIAQSRTALERDPGSAFLSQQLTQVLGKKLELLRTVARLPVRS